MPIRSDGEETRNRILVGAGQEFGSRGYNRVTNQDISKRSDANSAAISYYFRDKAGLYRETWAFLQARSAEQYTYWLAVESCQLDELTLDELRERFERILESLVRWHVDPDSWDSEILRYERIEPTGLLNVDRDVVEYPLRAEMQKVLALAMQTTTDDPIVLMRNVEITAALGACCHANGAFDEKWSAEELCKFISEPFLYLFQPQAEKAKEPKKRMRRQEAGFDDSQLELGVTDEVAFSLKPVTEADLDHMARIEEAAKQKAKEEEQLMREAEMNRAEEEDSRYFQGELF